jgi:hypothetical protein
MAKWLKIVGVMHSKEVSLVIVPTLADQFEVVSDQAVQDLVSQRIVWKLPPECRLKAQ